MNIRRFLSLILLIFNVLYISAAYVENIPQTVVQPNGDTLHCFASGDEYFHYLHDADGYTIVQDPATGYFVYAVEQEGRLQPTAYVAGRVAPASVGLAPRARISAAEWQRRRARMTAPVLANHEPTRDGEPNHGNINNLVIFIRFADSGEFGPTFSEIDGMFNDSTPGTFSMINYFRNVSYNQLDIRTYLYPQGNNDAIVAYEYGAPINYFMPWSETNPIGYVDTLENDNRTTREMWLLRCAVEAIAPLIPADLNLDYNNDGLVDNICFVVCSDVAGWSDLLWPHRWSLYLYDDVFINGKRVYDFNFTMSENDWYFGISTLCHEMSHTLSAPDLYHYSDSYGYTPVGSWDLMAQNAAVPQQWGAWMKYRYGHWIDDIPTITESGKYTLLPLTAGPEQVAYQIPSEVPDEFFVIEFRDAFFEPGLPGRGALVYRIAPTFSGNAGWNGEDVFDEVYIYRPGGTDSTDGNINKAHFSHLHGRTAINFSTNPKPFLTNGYISSLNLYDIHPCGHDSLTFWYLRPGDTIPAEIQDPTLEVRLFPNPTVSQFTVQHPAAPIECVEVFDLNGRRILTEFPDNQNFIVNTSDWPAGMYVVRLRTKAGLSSHRINVLR